MTHASVSFTYNEMVRTPSISELIAAAKVAVRQSSEELEAIRRSERDFVADLKRRRDRLEEMSAGYDPEDRQHGDIKSK